jgi:hypothetical protein
MEWITEDEIRYFKQLDERQRRLFAGLKAKTLGRTGVRLVCERLELDARTVRKGKSELNDLPQPAPKRLRKTGGGPKKN